MAVDLRRVLQQSESMTKILAGERQLRATWSSS